MTATQIKPGDPPPFWDGLWHPRGESEGAVQVRLGVILGTEARAAAITRETPTVPDTSNPPAAPQPESRTPASSQPAQPRSWTAQLAQRSPLAKPTQAPVTRDGSQAANLFTQARQFLAQKQMPQALQALQGSLECAPAQGQSYALMAQILQASRAPGDALHHATIAWLLNPKDTQLQRIVMQYAWVAGYVGWTIQNAQQIYRTAPSPDIAELGKISQQWLTTRKATHTAVCAPCKKPQIVTNPAQCATCNQALANAPANAQTLQGIFLLQQQAPYGRLFAGCRCVACGRDTPLILQPGGARCIHCDAESLSTLATHN